MKELIEQLRKYDSRIDQELADALEQQAKQIEELAAALAANDEALEWAQQNIDCIEDADERDRCSKYIDKALALQPHASLVAKIKADAVREAATHVGSGMYCAELVEYADRIERGEVK